MNENAIKTTAPVSTKKKTQKAKKSKNSLDVQKSRMGWLFISPFLAGLLLIYLPMILESITFSFSEMEFLAGTGGYVLHNVGWKNYSYALFTDAQFVTTLFTSIKELAFNVPAIVIFSLFMAVLLNQKMRGRALFRAIFFIPVIVSTGIIESIDLQNSLATNMESISSAESGGLESGGSSGAEIISAMDINRLFSGMQIGAGLVNYVSGLINDVYNIVNKSGVQMLIFLAGLQSIPGAIYESCYMDGASPWETFWKITFPMISPMILVNAVYTVIDSFTSQSNQIMTYISGIYKSQLREVSTAMSWMYFLLVVLILALVAGIMSAYVFYQRKDV